MISIPLFDLQLFTWREKLAWPTSEKLWLRTTYTTTTKKKVSLNKDIVQSSTLPPYLLIVLTFSVFLLLLLQFYINNYLYRPKTHNRKIRLVTRKKNYSETSIMWVVWEQFFFFFKSLEKWMYMRGRTSIYQWPGNQKIVWITRSVKQISMQ